MKYSASFFAVFLSVFTGSVELLAKDTKKTLDLAKIKHSQITMESSLYGVFREGTTVLSFPGENTFYLRSIYNPEAKETDLGFGSLHNPYDGSERISFEPKDKIRRVRSVLHVGSHWAFLDVMNRQFMVWDDVLKSWQMPADLILDTPRPPRDRQGEPTRAEVAALRAELTKVLTKEKANPDLLAGITGLPQKWRDHDGSQYVVWLRAGRNPLLTVKCDLQNFRVCQVQRACFVRGLSIAEIESVNSVSLDPKGQEILLLMRDAKKIVRLSGSSCLSLKAKDAYTLPKSLENAQGIFVDTDNNFWLALRESEGASSASILTWESKSW